MSISLLRVNRPDGALVQPRSGVDLEIPYAGVHVFSGEDFYQGVFTDEQRLFGFEFEPVFAGEDFGGHGNDVFFLGDAAGGADVDGTHDADGLARVHADDGEAGGRRGGSALGMLHLGCSVGVDSEGMGGDLFDVGAFLFVEAVERQINCRLVDVDGDFGGCAFELNVGRLTLQRQDGAEAV